MHWTAFWASATSGASSCEAQSCKCSNEQWLEESKTWAVPYFAHMSCCYIALFERISEIWNCTLLKVCILLFVFLCGTTVELADLANCICIFLYFSTPLWSWLMWLIETRLRAKSVAILHLAFPLRYFQMALLKAALIISSEDFEKTKTKYCSTKDFFAWLMIMICKSC